MSKEDVRQFSKLVQFAEERMKLKVKILIKWEMHLIFCFSAFRFPFLINDSTKNIHLLFSNQLHLCYSIFN